MLVLSRRIGERLMIGNNIMVVVNKIGTKRVLIGIEAPAEVRVRRAELGNTREARMPNQTPPDEGDDLDELWIDLGNPVGRK